MVGPQVKQKNTCSCESHNKEETENYYLFFVVYIQMITNIIFRRSDSPITSDKPHYPYELPEGWVWTTLGEIGNWQSGATPSRLRKDYYGGNIPWLKTGDLNDGYISDIPEYITETALKETSVKLNPKDSVLIAMYGATIGKVGILSFPATTNQACCACTDYLVNLNSATL